MGRIFFRTDKLDVGLCPYFTPPVVSKSLNGELNLQQLKGDGGIKLEESMK